MSNYIIPVLIILTFVVCLIKKVPLYDTFTSGAKGAIDLSLSIFPCLIAIFWGVELFRASGLSAMLGDALAPCFRLIGVPPEISELVLLRPFSGSGSYAVLSEILKTYGADSYIGRCAAVAVGGSETVFYVVGVYFAGIKQKKLYIAIPIALLCNLIAVIIGCLLCRIM